MQTVAVLGAGSWGTALSVHLSRTGHAVRLWGRDARLIARLESERQNPTYLPGVELGASVSPTADLPRALLGATLVVVAVPSHGLRAVVHHAIQFLPGDVPLVSAVQGLEHGTWFGMSQVIADLLQRNSFGNQSSRAGVPEAMRATMNALHVQRLQPGRDDVIEPTT